MSIQDILLSEDYTTMSDAGQTKEDWYRLEDLFNANGIPYPSRAELPENPKIDWIKYDPIRDVFYTDNSPREDADLTALVDALEGEGRNIKFDPSIDGVKGVSLIGGMADVNRRVHIGTPETRRLAIAHYWRFLDGAREYILDPGSLHKAFWFLSHHPAFWYRYERTGEWITSYSPNKNYHTVTTDEDGKTIIGIESGANVPGTEYHYHDLRLDAWAPSFEEAYIQLAANVHKHFDLDGTDYEKDLKS